MKEVQYEAKTIILQICSVTAEDLVMKNNVGLQGISPFFDSNFKTKQTTNIEPRSEELSVEHLQIWSFVTH